MVPPTLFSQEQPRTIVLDACDQLSSWKTFQSAGVIVAHRPDAGALRFDVSFSKGSGYGGVFRNFDVPLPQNYELSFLLRATVPVNNFEVKISSDSAGENIWWVNNKNYSYPTLWKRIRIKKRHLGFAWGPAPAVSPDRLRRLEIVVTAGSGGSGSVWIDDIQLTPIPLPPVQTPMPIVRASSNTGKKSLVAGLTPDNKGSWISKSGGEEWYEIDYGYRQEAGGIALGWDKRTKGLTYDVLGSVDGAAYDTLQSIRDGKGGEVLLFTPESEFRVLRLAMHRSRDGKPYRLHRIAVVPSESLSTRNHFIEHLAASAERGLYPRYFSREASYWTIVGVASDPKEALFNEDGAFEVDKQQFSVEPFIVLNNGRYILTWANGTNEQSLADNYLPIPTVIRKYDSLSLAVTLIASGAPHQSSLLARYVLCNHSPRRQQGLFVLALRPYQVNPSYQWLNFEGGAARIDSLHIDGSRAYVGEKAVTVSGTPTGSAWSMDQGEISEHIDAPSSAVTAVDPQGFASGAFTYQFDIAPADSFVVVAAVPFTPEADEWRTQPPTPELFDERYAEVVAIWKALLNRVSFSVPPDAQRYVDILRSNLAYVLINKDDVGFQPGSRSYERSWIRDGCLTSSALLKMGISADVKEFVSWYSSYQYENGMVPCVVDRRGPDPVPENDSHGELIFACMEYFRFTGDTAFLRARWLNIKAAVGYMQQLRSQRMTEKYRSGSAEQRACYGLLTESISHEGYSAKPMHSYWDDFFSLKGFKDAAAVAHIVCDPGTAQYYDSLASAFRSDLYRSITVTMKNHNIDYVPGCVELGDFDPTSTTIALFPCGEMDGELSAAFRRTFDKYYTWFQQRAASPASWNVYTPYEIRTTGSFLYLGWKERTHTALEWFFNYQRPHGWNHWAEVVWNNERRAQFIGDMPHTWVGSDYINAVRALFAYENDDARSVVIGAGLKDEWIRSGLSVEHLPTHYGEISYTVSSDSANVTIHIQGHLKSNCRAILVPVTLLPRPLQSAAIDGVRTEPRNGYISLSQLPATVRLR
ncbi:MAG: hypothetical protein NTV54_10070 [Ignavibacteriales bacterium]|nr:hypothetical protein [Ignavibacteriales bacterium]